MDIAVGVLLAVAGLVLVGLVAALLARRRPPSAAVEPAPVDDLADFLESPPGTAASTRRTSDSVVALAPAPPPPAPATPRSPLPIPLLAVLGGLFVLLLVAAGVLTGIGGPGRHGNGERRAADHTTPAADAQLRFGGLVLEERAVGVTVSYPELVLGAGPDGPVASLELPTWNCLATEAPEDPAVAGCVPGRTEYAELDSRDLSVTPEGEGLRIAGEFATTTRPAGGDPEPTGRIYDMVVTVEPDGSGELELGHRSAEVVEGELRIHD